MRWTSVAIGAFATALFLPATAWAGDEKGEMVAREEFMVVLEGLEGEQVERCVAELKEHHPAVHVNVKDGVLKLHATDAKAFEAAMAALKELGIPTGGLEVHVQRGTAGAAKRDGKPAKPKDGKGRDAPSDEDFAAKIEMLEKRLGQAREAGREREVAELEQALEHARAMRKEAAAARAHRPEKHDQPAGAQLEELRRRLEEAKRALEAAQRPAMKDPDSARLRLTDQDLAKLRRELEGMAREAGPARKHPGGPPELQHRMEHTRQALKHLKEAGLHDQAEHVERALHRMEMAAQGERGLAAPHAPGEVRVIEVVPARRLGGVAPMPPPPPAPQAFPQAFVEQGPPPSVGGVRRGPIQHRKPAPRVIQPPAPPAQPMPPQGGMILIEREHEAPWQPRLHVGPGMQLRAPAGEPGRGPGMPGRGMGGPAAGAPAAPPPGLARELEQLRRELEQLKQQLHEMAHHLKHQQQGAR